MPTEVFRFMTIRPPQEVDSKSLTSNSINLNISTDFLSELAKKKKADSREDIERLVKEFVKDNSFINSRQQVDPRILSFYESLIDLDEMEFYTTAKDLFNQIFGIKPKDFLNSNDLKFFLPKIINSIVAVAIDQETSSKNRNLLVSIIKTIGLIQKLAQTPERKDYSKSDFHSQIIMLPEGIFPLPLYKKDTSKQDEEEKKRRERLTENKKNLVKLSKELVTNRNTINDLMSAFEKGTIQPNGERASTGRNSHSENGIAHGFTLSGANVNSLTNDTKEVLKKIGFKDSEIDIAKATSMLEKRSAEISNKLYTNRRPMRFVAKIGNNLIANNGLSGVGNFSEPLLENVDPEPDWNLGVPGMCPPGPVNNEFDNQVTVPLEGTHGQPHFLGFADLMVVEQKLLRYELGDICHIENVLKSELTSREFRTATTTEQSTLTENETTEEKTNELSSTERFELQTESEKVINEESSLEAGLTVSASYGPTVEATSNFNYANSNSKQESNRASTNFGRDTTTKATNRIQKRSLERKFVKTINEVEETHKHKFDNTDSTSQNISGIYRFVDKIYNAQIVNYGRRMILDFVVPEPAAFVRHAITNQPMQGVTLQEPEPPGYCRYNKFFELQASEISRDNYLFWTSKYLTEDVEPPPPQTLLVSEKKGKSEIKVAGREEKLDADHFDVAIPDGYRAFFGNLNVYGETQSATITHSSPPLSVDFDGPFSPPDITIGGGDTSTPDPSIKATMVIQVQKQQFIDEEIENNKSFPLEASNKIPVTINTNRYHNYEVIVNVSCTLSNEKFQEWQLKTYNSIMNAYRDQKNRYDTAMEAARIRSGFSQISGTNPLINRQTEKLELKKGCISLLTAQNFESFDSMRRNVSPYGYPEIAFADANNEGKFIQFFENAFEWGNMTYIFYPYFWGKKEDWITISRITDNDPLYTYFLQAGAARVQVPVRPGFETSIQLYLSIGKIWNGEGYMVNFTDDEPDPLYLSVIDELKEQLGNYNLEGVGRLNVRKNNNVVKGDGTQFTKDDENKRIIIKGKTYIIKKRISSTEIHLTEKFTDDNEDDVRYSFGAKLVGEPWEVKLPTNLVMIDDNFVGKIEDPIVD